MIKAIVTDIEGTTTSISFVYDILFPYAREHMAAYITEHASEKLIAEQLREINNLVGKPLAIEQAIQQLISWMDEDKKVTPLKTIQGFIWEDGYTKHNFTGHVYEDVPTSLKYWHNHGISLYVYSSGSIKAQKLLFSHTQYGDLSHFFTDYFDTTIGNKRESPSYERITGLTGFDAGHILFLSDVYEELDAAAEAGLKTVLVDREGNKESRTYLHIKNFSELEASDGF